EDGIFDQRTLANAEVGDAATAVGDALRVGLIAVGADDNGIAQGRVAANDAAHANDAALQSGAALHHTAIADQRVLQPRPTEPRCRQITHACVDDTLGTVEVERRIVAG